LTIEVLIEAFVQVLDKEEDPKLTTNHVAQRAGFSIGTLYRYFPDKGAILRFAVLKEMRWVHTLVCEITETSGANSAERFLEEVAKATTTAFGHCETATHNIRELAMQDKTLVAAAKVVRLATVRRIHDRLRELEPGRFAVITDAELDAVCQAFNSALVSLGRHRPVRVIDPASRAALIAVLLGALPSATTA